MTPSSPWSVRHVQTLPDYRLAVSFADGTQGIVDLSNFITGPQAGVFSALADTKLFLQAYIDYGAVTWPGELDLAPDAMYDAIKATGEWRPGTR